MAEKKPKEIVPEMVPIARRIKARRETIRLTQAEVAAEIGAHPDAYREWENAGNNMVAWRLPALAKALRCPIGYFFGEGEDQGKDYKRDLFMRNLLAKLEEAPP